MKRDIKMAFKRYEEPPKTKLDWYMLGRVLGRGSCSKVNLALHILTRKVVALKSVNKNYLEQQRLL
jgi:serine/threonine protein kinase